MLSNKSITYQQDAEELVFSQFDCLEQDGLKQL